MCKIRFNADTDVIVDSRGAYVRPTGTVTEADGRVIIAHASMTLPDMQYARQALLDGVEGAQSQEDLFRHVADVLQPMGAAKQHSFFKTFRGLALHA